MKIKTYNGEKFERNKLRYVGFSLILIGIIGLSLWKQNIVGVIVLFFILGAYFYYSIISNQIITIKADDNHLTIDDKVYLRGSFLSYSIEIEKTNQEIKNIILITQKGHYIYTIKDEQENIDNFLTKINNHIQLVGEYNQSSLEKLARILKL